MSSGTAYARPFARLRESSAAWAFVVLALTWGAAVLFLRGFDSVSSVRYLAQTASYLGIIAVGQTLVIMMSGIDLSVSGVVALSAVVCAQVTDGSGGTAGIAAALIVSVAVGVINAAGVTWLLVPPMVMTLATGIIISGALLVYTNGAPESASLPLLDSLATGALLGIPQSFLLWMGLSAVCVWLLHFSRIGRYMFALGTSGPASRASGVPVAVTAFASYATCSLLAGLAGLVLLGFTGTSSLTMGDPYQLLSIAAVVLGGTSILGGSGHLLGTVAGTMLLTLLTAMLVVWNTSQGLRQVVLGLLIIGLLFVYGRERRT